MSFSTEKGTPVKQKSTCYAGGVATAYSKKSPFRYNKVVQAEITKGKVILWPIRQTVYPTVCPECYRILKNK